MSPTAGVGDQEYVAVNTAAIFCLLAGFAGIVAFISPVLGVVPAAAICLAALSFRQINQSNGTQTGRGLAMTGLFLGVTIGSFVATSSGMEGFNRQRDRDAIASLCQKFGQDMKDRTFDSAYDMFSQRFKARVPRKDFVEKLNGEQERLSQTPNGLGLGEVVSCHWNGIALFFTDSDSGAVTARSDIMFHFAHSNSEQEFSGSFRKSGDVWEIEDITELFPGAPLPKRKR